MDHLDNLDLAGTGVTDAGLEHLKGLRHLGTLNLAGTKVTEEGVTKLWKLMPECRITTPYENLGVWLGP